LVYATNIPVITRGRPNAAINVKQGVKLYGGQGIAGFYEEPRRRGAAVLTPGALGEVQRYLHQGKELAEVATRMDLLTDTRRKAVPAGNPHCLLGRSGRWCASRPAGPSCVGIALTLGVSLRLS
jgi:hypothetical protein